MLAPLAFRGPLGSSSSAGTAAQNRTGAAPDDPVEFDVDVVWVNNSDVLAEGVLSICPLRFGDPWVPHVSMTFIWVVSLTL